MMTAINETFARGAEPILYGAVAQSSVGFFAGVGSWGWFLIGAWFAVLIFFIITLINGRRYK
ncbi:MAG: hypothetical protein U5N10_11055 [Gemmobacter sp.]|nr:hypothetical protein [Gemmobacter sp.]